MDTKLLPIRNPLVSISYVLGIFQLPTEVVGCVSWQEAKMRELRALEKRSKGPQWDPEYIIIHDWPLPLYYYFQILQSTIQELRERDLTYFSVALSML